MEVWHGTNRATSETNFFLIWNDFSRRTDAGVSAVTTHDKRSENKKRRAKEQREKSSDKIVLCHNSTSDDRALQLDKPEHTRENSAHPTSDPPLTPEPPLLTARSPAPRAAHAFCRRAMSAAIGSAGWSLATSLTAALSFAVMSVQGGGSHT